MKTPKTTAERIKEMPAPMMHKLEAERQSVFERFPILFALLGTFGVVATFLGFELLIQKVDVLNDNPIILIATGIITLIITGSLYKKLG